MNSRVAILSLLLCAFVFLPTATLHAASIPILDGTFHIVPNANDLDPLCPADAPLSFGAVMEVAQKMVNAGISFGILIFVIMMAWGGFLFITSAVNPESRNTARKMLGNAALGLLIILSAWLMVDFVMKTLYSGPDGTKGKFGPWNSILGDGPACVLSRTTLPLFNGSITAVPVTTTSPAGSSGSTGTGGSTGGGGSMGTISDGIFSYDPGIREQKKHLSAPLASALTCIAGKVPANVGRISSISDSKIVNGSRTFAQCAASGCAHTANSCHYGGRSCVGSSFAVDFGDDENMAVLTAAAKACGAKTLDEGNHLHVSVGATNGCGCSL